MYLLKRIGVALFWIPLIIFFIVDKTLNGIFFTLFLLAISVGGSFELYNIFKIKNISIPKYFIIPLNFFIILSFYISTFNPILWWVPYFSFVLFNFIFFIPLICTKNFENIINISAAFVLLAFYIPFLLGHLILLKSLDAGIYFLTLIIFLIWTNDSFAYFCGALFGRKKWNIKASPNKTYAGVAGGLVFSVLSVFFINYIFKTGIKFKLLFLKYNFNTPFIFNKKWSLIIGLLFGILVIVSDLIESLFKRCAKLKDSSNFLPGHGGILDVFDSIIFTVPLFYYFIFLLKYFKIVY